PPLPHPVPTRRSSDLPILQVAAAIASGTADMAAAAEAIRLARHEIDRLRATNAELLEAAREVVKTEAGPQALAHLAQVLARVERSEEHTAELQSRGHL